MNYNRFIFKSFNAIFVCKMKNLIYLVTYMNILVLFLLFSDKMFWLGQRPIRVKSHVSVPTFLRQSLLDSLNYFNYSDSDWALKKKMHGRQRLKQIQNMDQHVYEQGHFYFTHHWDPTWSCDFEERVGGFGDGGKWVCDTRRISAKQGKGEECNIISVGSQNEFSFENAIHDINPECNIYIFDHTASSVNAPNFVKYFHVGFGSSDRDSLVTLKTALHISNLTNKIVDILKIDCEGCEYEMYHQFASPEFKIMQILMEVHFTSSAAVHNMFQELTKTFVIFHKEPNLLPSSRGDCVEFGFLRVNV